MTIRPITTQGQWDPFLAELKPNTFLQSWQWGQVQQKSGEKVTYLGLFDGNIQIGAVLVILVNAKRGRFYLVPHGPLFKDESLALTHLPVLVEYLKNSAKQDGTCAIRIAPLLIDTPDIRQLFKRLHFRPAPLHVHAELTWVLDITKPEDVLLGEMRKTTRHAIKKGADAGIVVEILTDPGVLKRFWPLYQSTTVRQGFVPFEKEFIKQQLVEFSNGNHVFMAIATHQGRDVAGAILMHTGDTVFYYHGASKKLPATLPAAQVLQWVAIREAKRREATRYNFWGIAPENEPKHPFAGITVFKKGFGGYALDYLHAQDLPLSPAYWKLWAVEMYRKYKRGF